MRILGIETSCDETGVTLIEATGELDAVHFTVVESALFSQAVLHEEYGGVFPTLAKREHAKNLVPLLTKVHNKKLAARTILSDKKKETIEKILEREPTLAHELITYIEQTEKPNVDHIAVTYGPGLPPTLWVGVTFAEALGIAWDIPVFGMNHMEGHIISSLMQKKTETTFELSGTTFPILALLISGSHTELVLIKNWMEYQLLGRTRDDAVGEAFDKVARTLGLPYPGGPKISKLAEEARTENLAAEISLPRPMMKTHDFDFSFSGIKTAVLYLVRELGELSPKQQKQIAREFEDAVTDVLLAKTVRAIRETAAKTFTIGGGVAANKHIREVLKKDIESNFADIEVRLPTIELTGDNAIMIACAAYFRLKSGAIQKYQKLAAEGNLRIEN